MKGLQALNKIKKGGREDDDFGWLSNSYLYEKEIAAIENELKALEIVKKRECLFKGLSETTQEELTFLLEVLK